MAVKVNLGLNEEYMFFNDGYINCGDTTTMDGLTGFTIEFKVKMEFLNTYPTLTGARGHNFVNKGSYYNSASSFAIGMSETASSPATVQNRLFFSRGNSYYNYVNLYGNILTDTWYHMSFVQNDTGMYIYINGDQVGGAGQGTLGPIANTTHLLTIGGLINGKMDEIRIWNYPRTQQQIVDNINLQLTAPVAGLIHLYQAKNFNNNTGVLTDAAGSVNGTESASDKITSYLAWREMGVMKINIGDVWKSVMGGWINIGDTWKKFYEHYYVGAWGLYYLENNVTDSSGNNRTLTNTNATFTTTAPCTNESTYRAVFNGTNAKMVGPVCYMNTDFTVSAWMTLPTTTKGYDIVNADNIYNQGWWMTCYGGTGVLGLNIGIRTSSAGVKEWYSGNKATAGETYNMIFCRDGLRYYGYINGVKVLDNTLTSGSGQISSGNNISLQLGVRYIDNSKYTTYTSISLDDVFINKTTAWSDDTCVSYYNQYKK